MNSLLPFHSLLVIGATSTERQAEALNTIRELRGVTTAKEEDTRKSSQEELIISPEGKSIGIDQIRKLKEWASFKTSKNAFKTAVLYDAEHLTIEAQNSLLKILEEPPKQTLIILTAPHQRSLLPTLVSRCFLREIKGEGETGEAVPISADLSIKRILDLDLSGRLELTERFSKIFSDREELLNLLDQWFTELRSDLLSRAEGGRADVKKLLDALERIVVVKSLVTDSNANSRLAIETFLARSAPECPSAEKLT